ncbi:MAG: DoxX family membrane protein [Acidobacteria bacterium]|nr:MAG: DoxX family membrane protein [Acidobacteriota bacterium]
MAGIAWLLRSRPALIISRLIVGGIFIYAAVDKIAHPDQFAEIVNNYKLMPAKTINVMAIIMPWLELVAGVLLVAGVWVKDNAAILGALLLVFIVAISINLARGLDFDCGCFSTAASTKNASIWLLVRDIALLLPVFHLLWFQPSKSRTYVFVNR